jgi:hypothetical protein
MKRIKKWLNDKPHTKAMYITAAATVVMTILTAIMSFSVIQNQKSLAMTAESLSLSRDALKLTVQTVRMQEQEFRLRNRPFIAIKNMAFGGPAKSLEGDTYQHAVVFHFENLTDIPARNIVIHSEALLNGKRAFHTLMKPGALTKGGSSPSWLFLRDDTFNNANDMNNRFEVVIEITYSGMLGEGNEAYRTYEKSYYSPTEKIFKYDTIDFR